jgi:hypothetical protein
MDEEGNLIEQSRIVGYLWDRAVAAAEAGEDYWGFLPLMMTPWEVKNEGIDTYLLENELGYVQDAWGNWVKPSTEAVEEQQDGGGGRYRYARRGGYGYGGRRGGSGYGYPYVSQTGRYYNPNEMGVISWRI